MYLERCIDRLLIFVFWVVCVVMICGLAHGAGKGPIGLRGPIRLQPKKAPKLTTMPGSLVSRVVRPSSAGRLVPVREIFIPETLDGPRYGRNPGQFEPLPEGELGQRYPLPEEIDPSKIPGWNGPDREAPRYDPSNEEPYLQYIEQNDNWDISDEPDSRFWNDATERKLHNWGSTRGHPLIRTSRRYDNDDGKGGGKEDGGKPSGGTAEVDKDKDEGTVEELKDEPIDEGSGGQPPIKKDPNPEGDDPDELGGRGVLDFRRFDRSAAGFDKPFGGSRGSGRSGVEQEEQERLRFQREHYRRTRHVSPDPEDGGPDELDTPAASAGFNGQLLRGYAAYPTPDDSDGPDDPRASDGGGSRVVGQGFMASPPDGGQGGQPIPPGPLFMRLRMRRAH